MPARAARTGCSTGSTHRLPFELTDGQVEVSEEILADLARSSPMHRLLQGEVGSGKTVVALRAMMRVIDSGGQAVLLAPTEVLAQQHHRSITALLGPMAEGGMLGGAEDGTRVALLTGSLGAAARRQALLEAASGGRASPSAPTPCSRSGSSSPTWAWSWSTSSTGSGSSNGPR